MYRKAQSALLNGVHADIAVVQSKGNSLRIRVQSATFNYALQILHMSYMIYVWLLLELAFGSFDNCAPVGGLSRGKLTQAEGKSKGKKSANWSNGDW